MRILTALLLLPLSEAFVAPSGGIGDSSTQLSMARYRPPVVEEALPDTSSILDSVPNVPDAVQSITDASSTSSRAVQVPTLSEYLKDPNFNFQVRPVSSGASWDETVSRVGEKFLVMKQNFLTLFGMDGADIPKINIPSMRMPSVDLKAANLGDGADKLLESLNVQEYGTWYLAGAAFLLAARQRSAGAGAAKKQYEGKLAIAETKAVQAAEAASVAAKGATMAKKMASKADVKTGEYLLEATKVRAMEVEKEMMAKEVAQLKAETADLKRQLEAATKKVGAAKQEPKVHAEKQVIARDPEEDKKILNIIKEKDSENEKNGVAKRKRAPKSPKKAAAKPVESGEMFFGQPMEVAPESPSAKQKTTTIKKKIVKKGSRKAAKKSKTNEDWSTLSMSTLKRKTVKDLSEYLSHKGVEVTDGDGKPKKKDELVMAVQNLQKSGIK